MPPHKANCRRWRNASRLPREPAPSRALFLTLPPKSEPSVGHGGQTMLQVTPRSGPPREAASCLGAAPTRFRVPETNGRNKEKRRYLNRITLIGFIGSDAERKAANATNIAIFSLATKTSWKNDAGTWESRTEWHRCVAFGKLADFAGT